MSSNFFNQIKNYFSFSKSQQAGLIIMFVLIILIMLANLLFPYFIKEDLVNDDEFKREIEAYRKAIVQQEEVDAISDPFPFDPNSISFAKMLELGLTEYQAKMIDKYRNAGGKFYDKEDFRKIYSITDREYEVLEPYIVISKPEIVRTEKKVKQQLLPKPFNPNDADSVLLSEIGLDSRQISNIINYRKAGGVFKIKSDFNKIYNIADADYEKLQKYILLPSVIDSSEIIEKTRGDMPAKVKQRDIVEINSADTTELTKLYGIGPYYAKKIIVYRDRLGGFYDKSQLLEVFGIDSMRYFKFENQVVVDKGVIKKLNLNTALFNEILKHPYFEYYMVKEIFNLKDAKGDFTAVSELRQIDLMYDELYDKIRPYVTVENKTQSKLNE